MKLKDVMIEDWVKCCNPERDGHQIDLIDFVNYQVGVDGELYAPNMLRPIPLTPEIMERNGFVNKRNNWMQLGNFGDQPLMMWYLKDDKILHAHKYQMEIHYSAKNCHCCFMCEYVHQFQHALKLVGIEKEIVL